MKNGGTLIQRKTYIILLSQGAVKLLAVKVEGPKKFACLVEKSLIYIGNHSHKAKMLCLLFCSSKFDELQYILLPFDLYLCIVSISFESPHPGWFTYVLFKYVAVFSSGASIEGVWGVRLHPLTFHSVVGAAQPSSEQLPVCKSSYFVRNQHIWT